MFRAIALSAVLAMSGVEAPVAQTVYAVLVGDTKDGLLGPGVEQNISNVTDLLTQIKTVAGINVVVEPPVTGEEFGCAAIRKAVNDVPWTSQDAVVFWYSGHGDRNRSDKKIFPVLNCLRHPEDQETETETVIAEILQPGPGRAPPRFLLTIIDACNKSIGASTSVPAGAEAVGQRKDAFTKLLLGYAGAIIASGSKQDEYSYYYGDNSGGYFTTQFLRVLADLSQAKGKDVTWDMLMSDAVKKIPVVDSDQGSQQPQYQEIGLRQNP